MKWKVEEGEYMAMKQVEEEKYEEILEKDYAD